MKRVLIAFIALAIVLPSACKKAEEQKEEGPIAKKYAKYRVNVQKDKDLKVWLATLEKGEAVDLLSEEKYITEKRQEIDLAKVRLADDKEGYIDAKHLADKPIVFIKETPVFVRPTSGSKVYIKLPEGTIGFIIDEKGNWVQVYVGKIEGKWVTRQWVEGGYTTDTNTLLEAKELEVALQLIKKDETLEKGKEKLKELAEGTSEIAAIARQKLDELEAAKKEETEEGGYTDLSKEEDLRGDDPEKTKEVGP
jgi:lipoprotein LenA